MTRSLQRTSLDIRELRAPIFLLILPYCKWLAAVLPGLLSNNGVGCRGPKDARAAGQSERHQTGMNKKAGHDYGLY